MSVESVRAGDERIEVVTEGQGPGLVLLHGGGVTGADYRRLSAGLADRFTVHRYDRYGPNNSRPPADRSLDTEIADLAAILEHTGARRIFGHSGGAFLALRAALQLDLDAVAVYDPPIPVDGLLPTGFFESFATAIDAGDLPLALALMGRDLQSGGAAASHLPLSVQKAMCKLFLATPIGRRLGALLPETVVEIRQMAAHPGPAADYAPITARVLLTCGRRSPGYYVPICEALARSIPHGRTRVLPGSHNAANIARSPFVEPFAEFYAAAD